MRDGKQASEPFPGFRSHDLRSGMAAEWQKFGTLSTVYTIRQSGDLNSAVCDLGSAAE